METAQSYWDKRSDLFGNYYIKPSLFDKVFRKGVYTRVAVATQACQELDEPTILDIGSGPGINSVTFLKNSDAKHLVGIDFAPNMIAYANETAKREGVAEKCEFIEGDFMTYDFGDTKYDLSAALGVFDYIENAADFIKRMGDVTEKIMVISWPEDGLRMALRRYRYTCPVYHYTEQDVRDLHAPLGLKELKFVRSRGGWVTVAYR